MGCATTPLASTLAHPDHQSAFSGPPRPARVSDATGVWGNGAALMERDLSSTLTRVHLSAGVAQKPPITVLSRKGPHAGRLNPVRMASTQSTRQYY